jgi:hypothetical protein
MNVALPVTVLNFLLPFLFDGDADILTNVGVFIVTSSLSSFKVRLLDLQHGSLPGTGWCLLWRCCDLVVGPAPAQNGGR